MGTAGGDVTGGMGPGTGRGPVEGRFLAFAFAASEMVVEVDGAGRITYAAGAFRSRLGSPPDSFVGNPLHRMVAPSDQDTLELALGTLQSRGRLLPCFIRLRNEARSMAVLSGLRLEPGRAQSAVCVTFGLPPSPSLAASPAAGARDLLAAAEARMAVADGGVVALLEVTGHGQGGEDAIATALERLVPEAMGGEVAPGRFGMLDGPGHRMSEVLPALEAALRARDGNLVVSAREIALDRRGLTAGQAGRALRLALAAFARGGTAGMDEAGFGDGLAAYVQGAMQKATALRQAIAQREFTLLYQPIVSLETRRLHHYEALLRPQRRIASHSPQEFVSLTETAGVSDELDLAVVAMACEAADRAAASIAVNISGQSMQDAGFRERLMTVLDDSPAVRAGRMLVEMTETAQVDSIEAVNETARGLKERDIRFCIDDFGAGTADIRLLRGVPTDIVKLDGSFVPGILEGGRGRAFVAGMIEIARASGAQVVAERIETAAEAEAMAEIGASFGQGWLFGRPAPLPRAAAPRAARRVGAKESWG